MGSAPQLRTDFVSDDLRKAARGEAARVGGVTMQIVRDWVERFNAHGPEGLLNVKAPGKRSKLNDDQRQLSFCYEAGPTGYGLHRQIMDLGYECIVIAPSRRPLADRGSPRTNTRKCGIQPAHQSLLNRRF
ncbi:helix-turn-helix domain-containing protein [Pararhizobium sp. DWP1-1-3]|uniref:helix-turn-helix domain-containing protein n=1 Tax=Pararhizobium sp. DWP1-1-3 TaxID=2804652 RepID=UPI003CE9A846